MKKTWWLRLFAWTLIITFTFSTPVVNILAETSEETQEIQEIASGTCGENLSWRLTSDGTLVISGTGTMSDYGFESGSESPWYEYRESIYSVEIEDGITYIGELVFNGCSNMTSVDIPNSVTVIGNFAFHECSGLTSITIPDSVTDIGYHAFMYCTGLTQITIPNSVTNIGQSAFSQCYNLKSIDIPNSVTNLGWSAFNSCTSLKDIVIPDSVSSIDTLMFQGCSNLQTVTIPSNVKKIEEGAFKECNSLTDIYYTGSKVEWNATTIEADNSCLENAAIHYYHGKTFGTPVYDWQQNEDGYSVTATAVCDQDPSLVISETVQSTSEIFSNCIEEGEIRYTAAFSDERFETQTKTVTVPAGHIEGKPVEENRQEATCEEDGCYDEVVYCAACGEELSRKTDIIHAKGHRYALTEWTWSEDFSKATALFTCQNDENHITSIEGEIKIRQNSFWTEYIATVEGPDGVIYTDIVDDRVWVGTCGKGLEFLLRKDGTLVIYGKGEMTDYEESYNYINHSITASTPWFDLNERICRVEIGSGVGSIGNYAFYKCTNLASITIPSSVTHIGEHAFDNCSSLTSIEIPDGVTSIENWTFSGCSSLTNIEIPDGVKSIGESAFDNCSSLTNIEIPSDVTSIEGGVFYGCSSLTNIKIPAGVTSIGGGTFSNCRSLTSIEIPDGVTSIENWTFSGCSSLTNIEIPDGVKSIGEGAFDHCNSLTNIKIPAGVTSIGEYAFSYCSSLTNIDIPSSVASIENHTFLECSSLTSIEIPTGVTSIGNNAFGDCSSLTNVEIPDSVISIGESAFYNCSSLTSIEIPAGVTSIGEYAFHYCSSLTSTDIPSSVISIGDYAFYGCDNLQQVYYSASEKSWQAIIIGEFNPRLEIAIIHYNWKWIYEDGYRWNIDENGNLFISGNVAMPDYALGTAPWYERREEIQNVEFQPGIVSIGAYALYDCSSLRSVEIPASITSIGTCAFENCNSLQNLHYSGTEEQWRSILIGENNLCLANTDQYYNWIWTYEDEYKWILDKNGRLIISGNTIKTDSNSGKPLWYYNRKQIKNVEILPGVETIDYNVFSDFTSMTSITIPASVTSIGGQRLETAVA